MKTREAAKTVKNAAKYLRSLAKMMANKNVAKNMRTAADALNDVTASLNRKADRKYKEFKVTGFTPQGVC